MSVAWVNPGADGSGGTQLARVGGAGRRRGGGVGAGRLAGLTIDQRVGCCGPGVSDPLVVGLKVAHPPAESFEQVRYLRVVGGYVDRLDEGF